MRGGFDDRLAGMEIGLAEFEMNDGAALGFQFFGAREDGERAFAAHDGHSGSDGSHGSPCCGELKSHHFLRLLRHAELVARNYFHNPLYMPPSTSTVWPVT